MRRNAAFFELFHINSLLSEWIVLTALFGDVPKDNYEKGCRMPAYTGRKICTKVFTVGYN